MKIKNIILISLILFGLVMALGCTGSNDQSDIDNTNQEVVPQKETPVQQAPDPVPEPVKTIEEYVFCFNNLQTEYLYNNLLSADLQNEMSEDEVHNVIYAYRVQGLKIHKYTITDETVSEDTAQMEIEFTWDVQGFRETRNKDISLVMEDNKWKITEELITM